jgi:hypothetical protein
MPNGLEKPCLKYLKNAITYISRRSHTCFFQPSFRPWSWDFHLCALKICNVRNISSLGKGMDWSVSFFCLNQHLDNACLYHDQNENVIHDQILKLVSGYMSKFASGKMSKYLSIKISEERPEYRIRVTLYVRNIRIFSDVIIFACDCLFIMMRSTRS